MYKKVSNKFKGEDGVLNRSRINTGYIVTPNNEKITKFVQGQFMLQDGCSVDGKIIGNVIAKNLECQIYNAKDYDLINKEIKVYTGLKYDFQSKEKEYIGNEITLENSIDKYIPSEDIRINGYTRQITTTGKQLYNYKDTNTVSDGITVDEEGWITATYDNTSGTSTKYLNYFTNNLDLQPNKDYLIVAEIKKMNGSGWLAPVTTLGPTGGQFSQGWSNPFENLSTKTYKVIRKTRTSLEGTSYGLRSFVSFLAGQSGSITFRLSVLEDTTVTEDNFVYEPFSNGVPSPSPDYPQEVEVAKGNNLFYVEPKTLNGVSLSYSNDGAIVLNGTATADCFFRTKLNNPIETESTLSYKVNSLISKVIIRTRNIDNTIQKELSTDVNLANKLINTSNDEQAEICVINGTKLNNYKIYVQLQKGSEATEYEPYNSIVVKSTGKNLFDKDSIRNVVFGKNDNGIITSNNLVAPTVLNLTASYNPIKVKKGEIVYISADIKLNEGSTGSFSTLNDNVRPGWKALSNPQVNTYFQRYQTSYTYQEDAEINIILIQMVNLKGTITVKNIKISKESDIDWEPYQESKLTYSLNDNFLAEQDYIQDNKLYKNVAKVVLDGSESGWALKTSPRRFDITTTNLGITNIKDASSVIETSKYRKSTHFIYNTGARKFGYYYLFGGWLVLYDEDNIFASVEEFKQWLSEHPVELYYQLETPTEVELESSGELKTFEDVTYISNNINSDMSVKYDNGTEYVPWGNFIVDTYENVESSDYISIKAMNYMIKFNPTYSDNNSYPCYLKDWIVNFVKFFDVELGQLNYKLTEDNELDVYKKYYLNNNNKFELVENPNEEEITSYYEVALGSVSNQNFLITEMPEIANLTGREILKSVAEMLGSFATIGRDNKLYFKLKEQADIKIPKSPTLHSLTKNEIYGPINTVVLKLGQAEGENITKRDEESVSKNGEHIIQIEDNVFLNSQEKREAAIDEIFGRLNGFTYVDFSSQWNNFMYVDPGDGIQVQNLDNTYFDTILLNHKLYIPNTNKSTISAPSESKVEEKYQFTSEQKQKNLYTELRVNKVEGEITATTEKTQQIEDNLNNNYYNKTNINTLLQTAESGITNTFSEAGGNNIFRNTGLWFKNDGEDSNENPYEFWNGIVGKESNSSASSYTSMILQKGTLKQEQDVPNGNYSISFTYKKLIELANATVKINENEYNLDSLEYKQFYTGQQDENGNYITSPIEVSSGHISIEFTSDSNNSVEIYDIMCNKGSVKLAWSQNENEVTTDTVNISKGITITSSYMETIFKANANGIKILTLQGETIAYFTEKGLTTKEAIIEEKAEICGALITDVGDQTWFTRM